MMRERGDWRRFLLKRLLLRDNSESKNLKRTFECNCRLIESICQSEAGNMKMNLSVQRSTDVWCGYQELSVKENKSRVYSKAFKQAQNSDLYGNVNSQQLSSLEVKLELKRKALAEKEELLQEQMSFSTTLKAENHMLKTSLQECTLINTTLRDEYTALQLAVVGLETKLAQTQEENKNLIERLNKYKTGSAEIFNSENEFILDTQPKESENFYSCRRQFDIIQKALKDASTENTRSIAPFISTCESGNIDDPETT